jgi:hypothetical protein
MSKSQSFVKLLRKVIREEVRSAVKEILVEQKVNHNSIIEHGMKLSEITENPMPNKPRAKKQFTSNPMLNDLLNETAATPPSQEMMDYSTMNFRSEMAEQFGAERQQSANMPPLVNNGINSEPINMQDENVATVMNAMTRDYSGLIKAIDKKNGKMGTIK